MKTHVLMVAKTFPTKHPCYGGKTHFAHKIFIGEKIHTIRDNYELWCERCAEVNAREAVVSVREWAERPYWSKQDVILELRSIGVEKLEFHNGSFYAPMVNGLPISLQRLYHNDGLSPTDFRNWFKRCDLKRPRAIVHFTRYRYNEIQE